MRALIVEVKSGLEHRQAYNQHHISHLPLPRLLPQPSKHPSTPISLETYPYKWTTQVERSPRHALVIPNHTYQKS